MRRKEEVSQDSPAQDMTSQSIRFKCRLCRQPLEAELDMLGSDVECPNCRKMMRVPSHVFSINPFWRPMRKYGADILSIQWHVPYLPQVVEVLVLLIVLAITTALYLTIGIVSQVIGIFEGLMHDARQQIMAGSLEEKSAYAVAAGIYLLLWLPLWILLLPFTVLGWLWKHLGYFGLVVAVGVGLLLCVVMFQRDWLSSGVNRLLNASRFAPQPAQPQLVNPPSAVGPRIQ